MSSRENKDKFWKIISKIKTGMLVTQGNEHMHARPMQLVQESYDGTLWFFTNLNSLKVKEMKIDEKVCVTFSGDDYYVAMYGQANISKDSKKIEKFWNPVVSAWFPDGKDSDNCGLIEIKINHGELWDSDVSTIDFMSEIIKAHMTDSKPGVGGHLQF